jgi:hypothetical protein
VAPQYDGDIPPTGVEFDSPSRNIHCGFYDFNNDVVAPYWGCTISEFTYAFPEPQTPGEIECASEVFWGGGFIVDEAGTVSVRCGGGVEFGGEYRDVPTLGYGSTLTFGDMTCDSSEDGMRCYSISTGHGFQLSRSDYEVF